MSDFLADIAERSFTTAQAIRPRPMSVFEPFQATGTMGSAQQHRPEEDYRLPESDYVGTVSPAPVALTSRELSVARRESHTISVQAPSMGVSAAIADPQPVAPTIVVQPARQSEHRVAAIQPPPEHAPSIGPKVPADRSITPAIEIRSNPPVESPDGRQIATPSGSPAKEVLINRTDRESGGPVHQSNTAGTISERTLLKPVIERIEMQNSVATQLPRQPVASLHSRLETNSNPTINVTIGRIEVRATPASVQKQPKSNVPDTMNLDEYLRRRNGGGR